MIEAIQIWLSAALVIWIWSFVYKDNYLYRLAQHIFLGAAAGYSIGISLDSLNKTALIPLAKSPITNMHLIIPIIIGLLFFFKYSRRYYWVARYGVGIALAVGTALAFRTAPMANIIRQVNAVLLPLWTPDPVKTLNNWIHVVITLCALVYFIFTVTPRVVEGRPTTIYRVYDTVMKIGIYGMMVAFGATLANTIMTRLAFFISMNLQYLQPYPLESLSAIILVAIAILFAMRRVRGQ
ncbi:MAG: hypothetical protein QXD04_04100 [Candidatus Bathyarchaeia archaeon]